MRSILELKRKSDTAVFLGSGKSINEITEDEWEAIKQFDIWTVNNWVYHPTIVPDFYHIEVKYYNYKLVQKRLKQKGEMYKNVNFIFQKDKAIKLNTKKGRHYIRDVAKGYENIFEYRSLPRDPRRTHKPFTAAYEPDPVRLTKSYDMSITAIFELMWRLGYERIITFGIDLKDSYYFWTGGDPVYGEVHHQTNKAHENKPPNQPHATHLIKDFLVDFNRRWFKKKGRDGIYVGHISTALFPEISFINVKEIESKS